jgi:hypothetical protein
MKKLATALAVLGALTLGATSAHANRFDKDCGVYGLSGHVKSKNVGCTEARRIVKKFFVKAQAQGPEVKISGFACRGDIVSGGRMRVSCNKDGGRELVHYKGTISRVIARPDLSRRSDFKKCRGTVTTSRGTARNIRVSNMSCKKGKRIIRDPSGGGGHGQVMCLMGEPKNGGYLFSCISETGTVRFLFDYKSDRAGPAPRSGNTPCVDRYDSDQCRVKPSHWGLGAHPEMKSINWHGWGKKKAVGRGRIVYPGEA